MDSVLIVFVETLKDCSPNRTISCNFNPKIVKQLSLQRATRAGLCSISDYELRYYVHSDWPNWSKTNILLYRRRPLSDMAALCSTTRKDVELLNAGFMCYIDLSDD